MQVLCGTGNRASKSLNILREVLTHRFNLLRSIAVYLLRRDNETRLNCVTSLKINSQQMVFPSVRPWTVR